MKTLEVQEMKRILEIRGYNCIIKNNTMEIMKKGISWGTLYKENNNKLVFYPNYEIENFTHEVLSFFAIRRIYTPNFIEV